MPNTDCRAGKTYNSFLQFLHDILNSWPDCFFYLIIVLFTWSHFFITKISKMTLNFLWNFLLWRHDKCDHDWCNMERLYHSLDNSKRRVAFVCMSFTNLKITDSFTKFCTILYLLALDSWILTYIKRSASLVFKM